MRCNEVLTSASSLLCSTPTRSCVKGDWKLLPEIVKNDEDEPEPERDPEPFDRMLNPLLAWRGIAMVCRGSATEKRPLRLLVYGLWRCPPSPDTRSWAALPITDTVYVLAKDDQAKSESGYFE